MQAGGGLAVSFPIQTLAFLEDLATHNDKAWFDANRSRYEEHWLAPARAFVDAVGPKLKTLSPSVEWAPKVNGSIFRINRDTRFSKDKTPYKVQVDLWFWQGDRRGWDSPGFFFRLTPQQLIIGAGMHTMQKEVLSNFRAAVDRDGDALAAALRPIQEHPELKLGTDAGKLVPRGYAKDHKHAELLKLKGLWGGYEDEVPSIVHEPGFADWCVERWAVTMPLQRWLLESLKGRG